jgi:hypothetical protein
MPFQEKNTTYLYLNGSSPGSDLDTSNEARKNGECLQLELSDLDGKNAGPSAGAVTNREVSAIPARHQIKACFEIQSWQATYARALIETDQAERIALVAEAERQILPRYLQLAASHISTDETLDLVNALDALKAIRNAAKQAESPRFFRPE